MSGVGNGNTQIYHVYKKSTGKYSGSGVLQIDNEDYGSTLIDLPYNYDSKFTYIFHDNKWFCRDEV